MTALSVPQDGLLLLRTPDHGPDSTSTSTLPSQVMRLNLAQKATEDILKSFQNKEKISIRFGKRVIVQHGNKSHSVFAHPEIYPSELYQSSTNDKEIFYFSGKLSHKLETQKAQTDTAKADEALANLESSLKSYEEQKASNEARFVTDKNELRHLTEASQNPKGHQAQASAIRKDRFLNTLNRSNPTSPFLGAAGSPAVGPTSTARSAPTSVSKDQVRLNAIKTPFLHLLAAKPLTLKVLAETIRATKEDCEKLLLKYSKDPREANGDQELKDKAYRELDPWKFPYPSESDRQSAIDRTISAFDRMRISTSDPIWETLLPDKQRGKGKGSELSRLKMVQAGPGGVTPKSESRPGTAHNVADTERDRGKAGGNAKGSATKTKPQNGRTGEKEKKPSLRKEGTKQSKDVAGKEGEKKERKKNQGNGKFKSSEVIEDSDEELGIAENAFEQAQSKKGAKAKANSSVTGPSPKLATTVTTATKSNKTSASSSKVLKPASSLMPNSALNRPRSEAGINKASPRPRTDSSPQKRSPLASSPPTNATDLENSQTIKVNSLSSSTSSPAISSQKASAPSKTSEARRGSTIMKRKAEDQPSPAPKRQQVNGNHVARPIINGTTNGTNQPHRDSNMRNAITNTASSSQRSRTPSSSSASTSASTMTATTTSSSTATATATATAAAAAARSPPSKLQSDSRRFKIQYARYQALHVKIMATPENERDGEEVQLLRKMHARIAELKREIWEGWEREREREGKAKKGVGSGNGNGVGTGNGNGDGRKV
jgi:RNA polymerase II elongation factor ELL